MEPEQTVLNIFRDGVHGDAAIIATWTRMIRSIQAEGLPDNLSDFSDDFRCWLEPYHDIPELSPADVSTCLYSLLEKGQIDKLENFHEYRLARRTDWLFAESPPHEIFFACNRLELQPLHYIRSKVQNFCSYYNFNANELDEIVISVTEAGENAVKYSDRHTVVIEQKIVDNDYRICVYNSISETDLNDEINRGKFSEDVSLMRGVLVMSKLLDSLQIERNSEKSRVEFFGHKKLQGSAVSGS